MKAVVVERPHQVSYREVDAPAVGADDVLVRSREAGLCRTDIEVMTGIFTDPRWVHFPVIPGHEWAGHGGRRRRERRLGPRRATASCARA